MNKPVKLRELIDQMDGQMDEFSIYFSKKRGEFMMVTAEELRIAEDGEDESSSFCDSDEEQIEVAIDIMENPDDYIEIPSKYDIHEYRMMEDFCLSNQDEKMGRILNIAIKGSGAFGRFRSLVRELGIEEEWYRFKDEAFKEIAIEWCEENGLEYEE